VGKEGMAGGREGGKGEKCTARLKEARQTFLVLNTDSKGPNQEFPWTERRAGGSLKLHRKMLFTFSLTPN